MDRWPSLRRFCGSSPFTRAALRLGLVLLLCLLALSASPGAVRAEEDAWSQRPFPRIEGGMIASLAVAPSNPAVLYALLEDADGSMRLFRSVNAAASWSGVYHFTQRVSRVVVHPANPDWVYAAGQGGLWRSTDAGQTWLRIASLGEAVAFPAAGYLYAAGVVDGTSACPDQARSIGFSPDGGDTWRFYPLGCSFSVYHLASSPAAPQTAYFVGQRHDWLMDVSLKTTDSGLTWLSMGLSVEDAFADLLVDPLDPSRLYASGGSGVIYSVDAGQSWFYPSNPGAIGTYNRLALAGGTLYAVPWSMDPSPVYASTNGGESWLKTVDQLVTGVQALVASPGGLYAGTFGFGVYRVQGADLSPVNDGMSVPAVPAAISAAPTGDLYAAASHPHWSLFRSRDGGKTWSGSLLEATAFSLWDAYNPPRPLLAHPSEPGTAWVGAKTGIIEMRGGAFSMQSATNYAVRDLSVSPLDANHPVAAANRSGSGYVLQRQCAGEMCNWEKILTVWPAFDLRSVAVDPNNPAHILALGNPPTISTSLMRVYVTTDGGATWNLAGEVDNYGAFDIAISPYDSRAAFIHFYGSLGEKSLYRSLDGGATWAPDGPPGTWMSGGTGGLAFDGLSQIYLASNSGLYRRPVASGAWALEGFEGRAVRDLAAVWGSRPYLWALTDTALYQTSLPAARRYWLPLVGR